MCLKQRKYVHKNLSRRAWRKMNLIYLIFFAHVPLPDSVTMKIELVSFSFTQSESFVHDRTLDFIGVSCRAGTFGTLWPQLCTFWSQLCTNSPSCPGTNCSRMAKKYRSPMQSVHSPDLMKAWQKRNGNVHLLFSMSISVSSEFADLQLLYQSREACIIVPF